VTAPTKNQSLKCSQQVRSIPLERYRLPDDGRKWKQAARSRSDLLVRLSTYANGDGTFVRNGRNYSPSFETLEKHVARKSFYRLTDALQAAGLLSWTRERHHDRRVYAIHLPEQVSHSQEKLPETGATLDVEDKEQVSDSPEQVSHSPKTGVTMDNYPSLPSEEPREREPSASEKQNLSLVDSKKSKAPRIVKPGDVAYVISECGAMSDKYGGESPKPSDVEFFLARFSAEDIVSDFYNYIETRKDDKSKRFAERAFFTVAGARNGAPFMGRRAAKRWADALRAAASNATNSSCVDAWVRKNPPPTECIANFDTAIAGAKRTQAQALRDAAAKQEEIKANGGTDFEEDAKYIVDEVLYRLKQEGISEDDAKWWLSGSHYCSFNSTWLEMELRSLAKELGPVDVGAALAVALQLLPPAIAGSRDRHNDSQGRFGENLLKGIRASQIGVVRESTPPGITAER